MEMTYNGALVMPSNYVAMDEEEMMYTNGGGTLTTAKVVKVLGGIGITIATAIELGTAGLGTLFAGAFY